MSEVGYPEEQSSLVRQVVSKGAEAFRLKRQIDRAPAMKPFEWFVGGSNEGQFSHIHKREPSADRVFVLPFGRKSQQLLSFLSCLEGLGFDLFPLASVPKGDLVSPTHGDIGFLQRQLSKKTLTGTAVRNKARLRGYFEQGRLHLRLYPDEKTLMVTAHIDPPDLLGHMNLVKHMRGSVKTDYEGGEDLFQEILSSVNSS